VIRRNSGVSSHITNEVRNTTKGDMIKCHCLIHKENLCVKFLKMTNVVTVVPKLINFVR
jgi:hypothetical protein